MESLRRFQSEPSLPNPLLDSGNRKMKSDLRQRLLYRHKQITPMSDKRHPIRSTSLAQKQPSTGFTRHHLRPMTELLSLVPTMPLIPFNPESTAMLPEHLWLGFTPFPPRSVYSCYSTGCLGDNGQPNLDNHHRTNILGPNHFIVEEENEALLAKEFQEAKIQSTHNSHSSMHSSHPQLFNFETTDFGLRNPNVSMPRVAIDMIRTIASLLV